MRQALRVWRRCLVLVALALPRLADAGQTSPASPGAPGALPVAQAAHSSDATEPAAKPTVVLVLLRGFRADYAARYSAKNLLAIAAHGASAPDGMLPSFPPESLPNSYTLVTGLYPGHHGIVGDLFRSGDGQRLFRGDDPRASADGSWYSGVPLWVLAQQQGLRAACLVWTGCTAEIAGGRPTFSVRAGASEPDDARVQQALAWLRLPKAERPHFVALALEAAGGASLRFGPESPQTRAAVLASDRLLGSLRAGIGALHLPIDLVVVSDYAAAEKPQGSINLDSYVDLSSSQTAGPRMYADNDAEAQRIYNSLKIADARFTVYRRANLPKQLHLSGNPRAGDPVVVPTGPFAIRAHAPTTGEGEGSAADESLIDDPRQTPAARAVFYAEGPDVRAGVKLQPFENTNVYPFVAALLGLKPPAVDGSAGVLSPALNGGS